MRENVRPRCASATPLVLHSGAHMLRTRPCKQTAHVFPKPNSDLTGYTREFTRTLPRAACVECVRESAA